MRKNLFVWQVVGICFTAVIGSLLHFLYQWTDFLPFALISAVNESTWEHMKLIFIPSLAFAFMQGFWIQKEFPCFWKVKSFGILIGTILIPILFYTLSGCFGRLSAIINISIFLVSVVIEYFIEYNLFNKFSCKKNSKWFLISILLIVLILFFTFTFFAPKIPLFLDPLTNTYGVVR